MVAAIRENTSRERNMGKDSIFGLMDQFLKVVGLTTRFKAEVIINGLMVGNTTANGRIIICMAMGSIDGKMVEGMKEISKTIRNTDMVCITGLMVEYMKVIGHLVNSTAKESTHFQMEQLK